MVTKYFTKIVSNLVRPSLERKRDSEIEKLNCYIEDMPPEIKDVLKGPGLLSKERDYLKTWEKIKMLENATTCRELSKANEDSGHWRNYESGWQNWKMRTSTKR